MKKTILLIESNASVRKTVEILLRRNFKIISISDIKDGAELLITNTDSIHAVICAYGKLGSKVKELLKKSKALLPKAPFIVFTTNSDAAKLKDFGADSIIEKPDTKGLVKTVNKLRK